MLDLFLHMDEIWFRHYRWADTGNKEEAGHRLCYFIYFKWWHWSGGRTYAMGIWQEVNYKGILLYVDGHV